MINNPTNYKDVLLNTREATHGNFVEMSWCTQRIKSALRATSDWENLSIPHKEALDNIALKMARIVAGNSQSTEHWRDIIGYGELGLHYCNPPKHPMTETDIAQAHPSRNQAELKYNGVVYAAEMSPAEYDAVKELFRKIVSAEPENPLKQGADTGLLGSCGLTGYGGT